MENSIVVQLIGDVVSTPPPLPQNRITVKFSPQFLIDFHNCAFTADRKDELIPAETTVQQNTIDDTNMTCKFGSLVLKVGEKIKSDKFCVDCTCLTPPMMHCVQNGHC